MKAITCSQCGALLKNFQAEDKFVDCEYCHARIPISKEKILEVSKTPKVQPKVWVSPYDQYVEKKAKYAVNYEPEPQNSVFGLVVVIAGIGLSVVFLVVIFLTSMFKAKPEPSRNRDTVQTRPEPAATYKPLVFPEFTPAPNVSFTSYVKYTTNLDAEHIELPEITAEQLTTFDHEELKKTVFKDKRIRVRVTISSEGEVTSASALNGHQVLRESSERAAKKSLFGTRKRETTSTLTYIYLLEDEKE